MNMTIQIRRRNEKSSTICMIIPIVITMLKRSSRRYGTTARPAAQKQLLSDLHIENDRIALHERSFYQWAGDGRRRPNRRLATAGTAVTAWLATLELSAGTLLFAFGIWFLGILTAVLSLIPLFVTDTLAGAGFIWWFRMAGLLTILGSTVVMAWIPLYLIDIRSAQ